MVVYDHLVAPEILAWPGPTANACSPGRRAASSAGPRRISTRLVALARAGKTVVRLKGGDPFIFGRGGEEAAALAAAGVPFEVVPGVTAALAAAAYAGIPLTHRAP